MAGATVSVGDLTIDVRLGDPVRLTVMGDVAHRTCGLLRDLLEVAISQPGSPMLELSLRLARFVDETGWSVIYAAQQRVAQHGRYFTIL